jgi:hypothetical protein
MVSHLQNVDDILFIGEKILRNHILDDLWGLGVRRLGHRHYFIWEEEFLVLLTSLLESTTLVHAWEDEWSCQENWFISICVIRFLLMYMWTWKRVLLWRNCGSYTLSRVTMSAWKLLLQHLPTIQ